MNAYARAHDARARAMRARRCHAEIPSTTLHPSTLAGPSRPLLYAGGFARPRLVIFNLFNDLSDFTKLKSSNAIPAPKQGLRPSRKGHKIMEITKGEFARFVGLSPARISQMVRLGLPVTPSGRINAEAGRAWIAANVDPGRRNIMAGRGATALPDIGEAIPACGAEWAIVAAFQAAGWASREEGLPEDQVERLAWRAAMFVGVALEALHGEGAVDVERDRLRLPERLAP
jgi:hypothetical protein